MIGTQPSKIFNDLILSYVIFTFNKLDLFPQLKSQPKLQGLVKKFGYDKTKLSGILNIAKIMGVVKETKGVYSLTRLGKELENNRGFFTWAIGGYSPLLEEMDTFLLKPKTPWQEFVNGKYVAIGSDECNQGLMQAIFDKVIDSLEVYTIADLGCGNAGRLVNLLTRRPELSGVGIDINPQAIEAAKINSREYKLNSKLKLVCENVFTSLTEPRAELKEVELVMSFMMLHDLFNIPELRTNLFAKMKLAFPKAKYFVFADTCLDEKAKSGKDMPIFTMGYELVHVMRGIQLFPLSYYKKRFAKGKLELIDQRNFGVPNTYLFILKPSL